MDRIPVIAGNWKMNFTVKEAGYLVTQLHYSLKWKNDCEIIVAPPFTAIHSVCETLRDSPIEVASQNINENDTGAFTGEVSALMVKDLGASFAIIGHSERRQYYNEGNGLINKKIKACFRNKLTPIVCVGETLTEREDGNFEKIISEQVFEGLEGLTENEVKKLIIAYEPVWAIGTGKTATPDQAQEAHSFIRNLIVREMNFDIANKLRILYGGSMKPDNAKELLSLPDVDGGLIGGASLKAGDFINIVQSIF